MPSAVFKVYIDEAGDPGFRFRRSSSEKSGQSSEWIVISAVICRLESDGIFKDICEQGIQLLAGAGSDGNSQKKFRKGLHFAEIKEHHHRLAWAKTVGAHKLVTAVVALNKKHVAPEDRDWFLSEKGRGGSNKIYLYALRILLRDICRWVKHLSPNSLPVISLVIERRGDIDYSSLKDDIGKLSERPSAHVTLKPKDKNGNPFPGTLRMAIMPIPEWGLIPDGNIIAAAGADHPGLQVADCISSSVYHMLGCNNLGVAEHSYAAAILSSARFSFSIGSHEEVTEEMISAFRMQKESAEILGGLLKR
jgi:hypothetical protein